MIEDFKFSTPKIKKFSIQGRFFTCEDLDLAFANLGLQNTGTLCKVNGINIDRVYVVNEITYMAADYGNVAQLLLEFINDKIANENYGDNNTLIYVVCDHADTIYRDIHKAGFVRVVDTMYTDIKVYVSVTPLTSFIYDIEGGKDPRDKKKKDKPMYS